MNAFDRIVQRNNDLWTVLTSTDEGARKAAFARAFGEPSADLPKPRVVIGELAHEFWCPRIRGEPCQCVPTRMRRAASREDASHG